jgi:Tfp pilus assembly protein PilX
MMHGDGQRGSILIYTLLSMSVMLAIGLTLMSLFVSRLRAAASARDATVALYAADSAAERCLYEARTMTPDRLTMDNGATFTVTDVATNADVTGDCSRLGSASFQFRATGAYRGSSRALEISQ